jgi:hypothetical protein
MYLTGSAFDQFLLLVRAAGRSGMRCPSLVPGHQLTREQLERVNRAYEEERNAHRARNLRGRAR